MTYKLMRYFIEDDWLVVGTPCHNMSLSKDEIDLIKVSWRPVLEDSRASGILLFKELFTKFPDYLRLFPKFKDLDMNNLDKNKRLIAHATKVIDTVTTVVNLLGDEQKQTILTEALQATAISHIRRHIGLDKFKNLGIILIDFMCQINHRYQGEMKQQRQQQLERNSTPTIISLSRQQQQQDTNEDLEAQTDGTDGGDIRIESALTNQSCHRHPNMDYNVENNNVAAVNHIKELITTTRNNNTTANRNNNNNNNNKLLLNNGATNLEDPIINELQHKMKQASLDSADENSVNCASKHNGTTCNKNHQQQQHQQLAQLTSHRGNRYMKNNSHHVSVDNGIINDYNNKRYMMDNENNTLTLVSDITLPQYYKYNIDTNRLVAAWTKLYSSILDIVKIESEKYDKLPKEDSKEEEDMSNASSQYNPSSSSSLDDDSIRPL